MSSLLPKVVRLPSLFLDTPSIQCTHFTTVLDTVPSRRSIQQKTQPKRIRNSSSTSSLFFLTQRYFLNRQATDNIHDNAEWYIVDRVEQDNLAYQQEGWTWITWQPGHSTRNESRSNVKNAQVAVTKSIQLLSRNDSTYPLLQADMTEKIRHWLPPRIHLAQNQWELLYSLDQHGASLQTLYRKTCHQGPSLLVVQDDRENIFGAYISESIEINNSFYGSGESFLWKKHRNGSYDQYPWTQQNNYFIYTDMTMLGFGSGEGHFGLCLDANMDTGSSMPCLTFGNPCLSTYPRFRCIGLEVWRVC